MAPAFIYDPLCRATPTFISTSDISLTYPNDMNLLEIDGVRFFTFIVHESVSYNQGKKKETKKEMLDRTSKEKMLASRFMFNEKIIEIKNKVAVIKQIKSEPNHGMNFIKRK